MGRQGTAPAIIAAVALGILGAGLVAWWLWPTPPQPAEVVAALPPAVAAPQPPAASRVAPRARTAVPRPTSTSAARRKVTDARPAASPPSAAPEAAAPEAAAPEGPVDRRAGAGQGGAAQGDDRVVEDIKAGMALVTEDIQACIEDWAEVAPDIDGHVDVAFQLGPEGLEEAWIVDQVDVPGGPLTCFSSAIWEVDWSGVTTEPLEVTFPFEVTTGPADEAAP